MYVMKADRPLMDGIISNFIAPKKGELSGNL